MTLPMMMEEQTPIGVSMPPTVPAGTDDWAEMQGIPPEEGPESYGFKPIDTDNIPKLSNGHLRDRFALRITHLVQQGVNDRTNGGLDGKMKLNARRYEAKISDQPGPFNGSCNISTPDTRNMVDTVAARLVESAFGQEPYAQIIPRISPQDDEAAEKKLAFLQQELRSPYINLPNRIYQALVQEGVDGIVFMHTHWVKQTRRVRKRVLVNEALMARLGLTPPTPEDMQLWEQLNPGKPYMVKLPDGGGEAPFGSVRYIEAEEMVANHFGLDFFTAADATMYPATAPSIEASIAFGHYKNETLTAIRQGVTDGLYDEDAVSELIEQHFTSDFAEKGDGTSQSTVTRAGVQHNSLGDGNPDTAVIKLWCGMVRLNIEESPYAEQEIPQDLYVVIDWKRQKILRCTLNPYDNGRRPYHEICLNRYLGFEFYGYGLAGPMGPLQKEANILTRQLIDSNSVEMAKIVEMEPGARRNLADTKLSLGINYHYTERDGPIKKVHEFRGASGAQFANLSSVREMMEVTAAANQEMQGGNTSGKTLGQSREAILSAGIRHKMRLMSLMTSLTWLYEQVFDYCQQFMEATGIQFNTIADGKILPNTITLDDMAAPCEVLAYCAALDPDRAFRAQVAEKIFTALAQSPFAQADPTRLYEILKYYVTALDPSMARSLEKYVGTKEQALMTLLQSAAQAGVAIPPELQGMMPGGQSQQTPIGV